MKFYFVYDILGPSGYLYNHIPYGVLRYFYKHNFLTDKETESDICLEHNFKFGTTDENFLGRNLNKIHINDISDKLLSAEDTFFIYYINTGGDLDVTLGDEISYSRIENFLQRTSKKLKSKIQNNKNFKIIINLNFEYKITENNIKKIYKICLEHGINKNKIYLISNNFRPDVVENRFINRLKIDAKGGINFVNYYPQLLIKGDEVNDSYWEGNIQTKKDLDIKNKPKKALIFNRRLHTHRLTLLSLLASENLLNDNLISFDFGIQDTSNFLDTIFSNAYLEFDNFTKYNFDTDVFSHYQKNKIKKGYETLKDIYKLELDVDVKKISGRTEVDEKYVYQNSYFSVVTETEFFNNVHNFSTEKSIKPIAQLHPFIIVGRPNTLKQLKKYGFKTFSNFWDESYDSEENNTFRMLKVFELIKKLINLPTAEWDLLLEKIKPILIYNKELLKKYSTKKQLPIIEKNLFNIFKDEYTSKNKKLF